MKDFIEMISKITNKNILIEGDLKGKINYRSRFRKWLQNSVNFTRLQCGGLKKGETNEKYTCTKSGRQGPGSSKPEARGLRTRRAYAPEGEKQGRKGFDLPSAYPIDAGGIDPVRVPNRAGPEED